MRKTALLAKREGPGVSCKKKQKEQQYLCLKENLITPSLENHSRTNDHMTKGGKGACY
jgi:hypothetical protein